jgi:hypothetical protein
MSVAPSTPLATFGIPVERPASPDGVPLTWIDNALARKAVCNDGTPAGYYLAPGSGAGATTWLIHLQGGGFCYDFDSCQRREQNPTQETSMSSSAWPLETVGNGNGLMSADPVENPDFNTANRVYIRYCSSDVFSGATDPYSGNPWYFRGRTILQAILDDLSNPALTPTPNLGAATTVILSGGSAGGIAVFPNLDWVANYLLTRLGVSNVYGLSDAGWLMDIPPYDSDLPRFDEQLQPAYAYWQAPGNLDAGCAVANVSQEWRCYIGQYAYPFIATPLFVYNSQYDADGLIKLGLTYPYDSGEMAYRQVYQAALVASLTQGSITPVFSPISEEHAIAIHPPFSDLAVVNNTLQSMLGAWVFDRPGSLTTIEYRSYLPGVNRFSQQLLISP